ncbi:unnamed protein product [Prorocentrum cordatum]|uniref:Uncharacterized protein n=1 Tax=Prorocentrum cordatum TaxID=2364126 RepID=A0ABN9VXI1_9DINO|nr:unnamed protein product [Polarella glacialis]
MERHPRFQEFIKSHKLYRVCVEMGRFGAPTAKPSWLYSAREFIQELPNYQGAKSYQPGQNMLVDMVKTSDGAVQINGNHRLKGSQAYPKAFGKAVADLYMAHRAAELKTAGQALIQKSSSVKVRLARDIATNTLTGKRRWAAADLKPVFGYLDL